VHLPQNPNQVDVDWPFHGIDHIMVRCGDCGPSLRIRACYRAFDLGPAAVSDHYGLVAELGTP
jgi:endonuclease/exonuclease/phosphatase family metal-dependent hydrolase